MSKPIIFPSKIFYTFQKPQIEPNSGDILLLRPLSPSLRYSLNVTVEAAASSEVTAEVEVEVEDENDHAPKWVESVIF